MKEILKKFADGEITIEKCETLLKAESIREMEGIAKFDISRKERTGFPEAILAESKNYGDLVKIIQNYFEYDGKIDLSKDNLIITRLSPERYDLLKKDLSTNQKVLTEDESPQDFASNIDLNLSADNSETTSEAPIDTNSTPDIDLDSNPESVDSGDNFGDINIGNVGEYGPDTENSEQLQIPTEPKEVERIIDVLEDQDGNIQVKTQNEDTKKVTTKKLHEIDVG